VIVAAIEQDPVEGVTVPRIAAAGGVSVRLTLVWATVVLGLVTVTV